MTYSKLTIKFSVPPKDIDFEYYFAYPVDISHYLLVLELIQSIEKHLCLIHNVSYYEDDVRFSYSTEIIEDE